MLTLIPKTVVVLLVCLVAADIVGAISCTLFDVLLFRGDSPALPYAIWLVLGIFCGLIAFNAAGAWSSRGVVTGKEDWTAMPGAAGIGTAVLSTSVAVIVGLSGLFYWLIWSRDVEGEYYVPDSEPHSIVFFVCVLAAIAGCRFMLTPKPKRPG